LGREPWPYRRAVLVIGGLLVAYVLVQQESNYYGSYYPTLWLTHCLPLAAIGGLLRWRGYRLLRVRRPDHVAFELPAPRDSGNSLRFGQFGLSQILIALAVVGLLLAGTRTMLLLWQAPEPWPTRLNLAILSTLVAAGMLTAMWSALSPRRRPWRLAGLAAGILLAGMGLALVDTLGHMASRDWEMLLGDFLLFGRFSRYMVETRLWMFAWIATAAITTYAALLLLRSLGYRLSRRAVALVPAADIPGIVTRGKDGGLRLKTLQPDGATISIPALPSDSEPLPIPRLTMRELVLAAIILLLGGLWGWDRLRLLHQLHDTAGKLEKADREYRLRIVQQARLADILQQEGYTVDLRHDVGNQPRIRKVSNSELPGS
jgi:hypothetical protein